MTFTEFRATALAGLLVLPLLGGCAQFITAWNNITGATNSPRALKILIDSDDTVQDIATTAMNGCTAAQHFTDVCAPTAVTAVHTALVASRSARDAAVAFLAANPNATTLGTSGVYEALKGAKDSLVGALNTYGVAVPTAVASVGE